MANPFDVTLKELVETYPADWLRQLGLPPDLPLRAINTDLATVSAHADKVFQVGERDPWLLHLEFQASPDRSLSRRMLRYSALLHERHALPVHGAVLLLRREADTPELRKSGGKVEFAPVGGQGSLHFEYQVIRLWEQPVEAVMSGGTGTLPLAPLTRVPKQSVRRVLREMKRRMVAERPEVEVDKLLTSTYFLMGLRFPAEDIAQMFRGIYSMRESTTYQAVLEEGLAEGSLEEARRMVLRLGTRKFGVPNPHVRRTLEEIASTELLEQLADRILTASTWAEVTRGALAPAE